MSVALRKDDYIQFDPITAKETFSQQFKKFPDFLLSKRIKTLINSNEKLCYMLVADRIGLSVKNHRKWTDEKGCIYCNFSRREMAEYLGLSEKTVERAMAKLNRYGFIREKRMGLNKPNRIYLCSPSAIEDYITPKNDNPEGHEIFDGVYGEDQNQPSIFVEQEMQETSGTDKKSVLDATQAKSPYQKEQNVHSGTDKKSAPDQTDSPHLLYNQTYTNQTEVSQTTTSPYPLHAPEEKPQAEEEAQNQIGEVYPIGEGKDMASEKETQQGEPVPNRRRRAKDNYADVPFEEILEAYNATCINHKPCEHITGKRKKQVAAAYRKYGYDNLIELFGRANASLFLSGFGERRWKPDFDWLIDDGNMAKVLEGKYDDENRNVPARDSPMQGSIVKEYGSPAFINQRPAPGGKAAWRERVSDWMADGISASMARIAELEAQIRAIKEAGAQNAG